MRQADLVKIINKTHSLDISQKVVKERINKIYKFIKNQVISNKLLFNKNELLIFETCIKSIEGKNFHKYTGAIFLTFLYLYTDNGDFHKVLKGKEVKEWHIEDFINDFEKYMKQYILFMIIKKKKCGMNMMIEGYTLGKYLKIQ